MTTNPFEEHDELFEIAVENPASEKTVLADYVVDILDDQPHTDDVGTRYLCLTRGHREREDTSKRVEVQSSEDQSLEVLVTDDLYTAIGIFIQFVEQHVDYGEADLIEALRDPELGFDIDAYLDWRDGLTLADRRERLLADAEDRRDRSPHVATYLDEGSFRRVDATETVEQVGQRLYEGIDPNPRRCYRNAIVALNTVKSSDHAQYVEGLALPKHAGRAVAHAWLELHGVVVDLTWPWHAPLPPEEAVYYGVPVETEQVLETTKRRNAGFNPILLDDADLFSDEAQPAPRR